MTIEAFIAIVASITYTGVMFVIGLIFAFLLTIIVGGMSGQTATEHEKSLMGEANK